MFSQTENKIKFNYLSFGGGIYKQQHYKNDGLTTNIDLSIRYNKNLVILYLAGGLGGNDNQKSILIIDALNSYSEFDVLYGKGISKVGNILDMAVNLDIVEKSGAWFSYNGQRISQGRENAKRYLEEHPDIMDEIEKKVRDNFAKAFEESLGEELPSIEEDEE